MLLEKLYWSLYTCFTAFFLAPGILQLFLIANITKQRKRHTSNLKGAVKKEDLLVAFFQIFFYTIYYYFRYIRFYCSRWWCHWLCSYFSLIVFSAHFCHTYKLTSATGLLCVALICSTVICYAAIQAQSAIFPMSAHTTNLLLFINVHCFGTHLSAVYCRFGGWVEYLLRCIHQKRCLVLELKVERWLERFLQLT